MSNARIDLDKGLSMLGTVGLVLFHTLLPNLGLNLDTAQPLVVLGVGVDKDGILEGRRDSLLDPLVVLEADVSRLEGAWRAGPITEVVLEFHQLPLVPLDCCFHHGSLFYLLLEGTGNRNSYVGVLPGGCRMKYEVSNMSFLLLLS